MRGTSEHRQRFKLCLFHAIKQTQLTVFTSGKPVRDHVLVAALNNKNNNNNKKNNFIYRALMKTKDKVLHIETNK